MIFRPQPFKLYNVIFPLWIAVFLPPYTLIPLLGNLIIDGLVITFTLKWNRVSLERKKLWGLIFKAWGFGFLADLVGVMIVLTTSVLLDRLTGYVLDYYFIWDDPVSVVFSLLVVAACGFLIFLFNRRLAKNAGLEEGIALRMGLAMGIITAPWLFLIPSSLIYSQIS
ncbi:hypothetical protein [Lihuaxuella thermophila]|uniref:Uncharacterized protein n=1 Tax=Lihuaxuella thermophila TaxID=1173111 RepID=A0A1H8HHV8_9BACL|nr:hypothetical protein [Lihuaxuella thermophila]SEN55743.1 hypothetical protein SAMN05444955_11439 [Lihuaxuella thermophila]